MEIIFLKKFNFYNLFLTEYFLKNRLFFRQSSFHIKNFILNIGAMQMRIGISFEYESFNGKNIIFRYYFIFWKIS